MVISGLENITNMRESGSESSADGRGEMKKSAHEKIKKIKKIILLLYQEIRELEKETDHDEKKDEV